MPSVEEGARLLERLGADGVVAVGGGSAVVSARASAILLAERKDVRELCTRRAADGRLTSPKLLAPKLPQWVVATTPSTAYAKAGSAVRDPVAGERLAISTRRPGRRRCSSTRCSLQSAPVGPGPERVPERDGDVRWTGLEADADDPLADALLRRAAGAVRRMAAAAARASRTAPRSAAG